MAFRDDVRRNLANAPGAAACAEQERLQKAARVAQVRFQQDVGGMCNAIKKTILSLSRTHTNPRIPFRVEMCVVAYSHYAFKSRLIEERKPGWFNNTRSISEMIISDEMAALRKAVKSQLARDGIQVSEWLFCDDHLPSDIHISNLGNFHLGDFHLYHMGQSQLKRFNINPNITFHCRKYQTIGSTHPHNHTEFTQGNFRYNIDKSAPLLMFVVKYQ